MSKRIPPASRMEQGSGSRVAQPDGISDIALAEGTVIRAPVARRRRRNRPDTFRQGDFLSISRHGFHRIAYTDWGETDPERGVVVCVHGLTRQGRDFDRVAAELARRGFRVICPDLPGRGRSDWLKNADDYELPQFVVDMTALIARLNVATVDWIGTSLGGLIGIVMAGQPISPIRRLVVNDIGPVLPWAALKRIGEGLSGRILCLKHHLPRLADHAQANNGLLSGKLSAPAVDGFDSLVFQFGQPVENGVEVAKHQAEKAPPHQISKPRECNQGDRQVEKVPGQTLSLAPLFQDTAMQEFIERMAASCRLEHTVESVQPNWRLQFHLSQERLQRLRHIGNINLGVIHSGGRQLAKILHEQKINLVAHGVGLARFRQEVFHQAQQPFLIRQGTGLQKLPQLMHLDMLVHLVQPALRLLDRLFSRRIDASFKIGARLHVDGELPREFEVDGV